MVITVNCMAACSAFYLCDGNPWGFFAACPALPKCRTAWLANAVQLTASGSRLAEECSELAACCLVCHKWVHIW